MAPSLKICFVASEAVPLAKTGGLADVAAALPGELLRRGHDVRLFLPFYAQIERTGREFHAVDAMRDVPLELGHRTYRFTVYTTALAGGALTPYLIDCPELYHRASLYTLDPDEAQRFALLARAAIECCQRMAWAPDIFHCNDWHTALIPFLLRSTYSWDALFRASKTLLTIHNLGYQGLFGREKVEELGLGSSSHLLDQEDLRAGRFNFLRTGLLYADMVSTVSPTYAREIQSDEYGMGLAELLRARRETLVGILNGVDYQRWDPGRDTLIPHRFSADDLAGKRLNKQGLLGRLGLAPSTNAPLLGIVSRLAHHKGFDLCFEVLPRALAAHDLRLVVLGSGERPYEEFFEQLQHRFPDKACYHRGYHDELAHVIEAASDMTLMPSRYEPCGLNQLFGMRYGTIPIVRRTGGLADSVEPVNGAASQGTGFVFEHFTPEGLEWALAQALGLWRQRAAWAALMQRAMRRDFSWESQAGRYVELYRRLAAS